MTDAFACCVSGGFELFEAQYPELCSSDTSLGSTPTTILGLGNLKLHEPPPDPALSADPAHHHTDGQPGTSVFPVEVLPHLFLGNCENSKDIGCLHKHGIKHIVNVTQDVPNQFERDEHIRYLRIPIKDHWSENLADFFYKAISFIGE